MPQILNTYTDGNAAYTEIKQGNLRCKEKKFTKFTIFGDLTWNPYIWTDKFIICQISQ